MPTEEKKPVDPLDLAADLLYETLATLSETSGDTTKREVTRNVLAIVQSMAQIDIANSLRKVCDELHDLRIDRS